jgi:hypothetical protein
MFSIFNLKKKKSDCIINNEGENNSSHSETTISTFNNFVSMSPDVNNCLVEYKTSQLTLLSPKKGNKLDIVDLGNLDSGHVQPILKVSYISFIIVRVLAS